MSRVYKPFSSLCRLASLTTLNEMQQNPKHQHKITRKPKATTIENGRCNTQIHHKTTATLESPKDDGSLQPPKTKQTQQNFKICKRKNETDKNQANKNGKKQQYRKQQLQESTGATTSERSGKGGADG